MAKSKFYAVRKGLVPGIYKTWAECEANVKGFSGAEYKSFGTMGEAEGYMAGNAPASESEPAPAPASFGNAETGMRLEYPYAFTDGSYNKKTAVSGWGGFLCLGYGAADIELTGTEKRPAWTAMRNVAGEVMGCMAAVAKALELGLPVIHIYHDYTGVSCWPDGAWSANKPETREYRDFIREARKRGLQVIFHKVSAHTGIPGNEAADRLAKRAVGLL